MKLALLVFTDGRLDYLRQTLASAEQQLIADFDYKMIMNDCPDVHSELSDFWGRGFRVTSFTARQGYCKMIREAWRRLPADVDYVFHLEDDFIFDFPVPVDPMLEVLEHDRKLAQMALLRHPVNEVERAAGNIIDVHPGFYQEKRWGRYVWHETDFSFTNNPNFYPRKVTENEYPDPPHGEGKFSKQLRELGLRFAFWGNKEPMVTHIGERRAPGGFY